MSCEKKLSCRLMIKTIAAKEPAPIIFQITVYHFSVPCQPVKLRLRICNTSVRYDKLGRFLAQQGISLYCHDQRGHGKTAAGRLGYLRKGVDWNMMINDLFTIRKKVIDEEVESARPAFLPLLDHPQFPTKSVRQTSTVAVVLYVVPEKSPYCGFIFFQEIAIRWVVWEKVCSMCVIYF